VELSLANKLCSLLFADDICLVASSLEDLQVMLDVCSAWATDMGMAFNASKSVLLVLKGPKQPPTRPMLLMGEPMTWQQEARYLGIIVTRLSRPTRKLPLVKPTMWASVFRLKRLLDPWLPIPLLTQVGLLMTDVMAGALYPAAVQDVDYDAIDVLINKQLRRLTITPAHASATWLRCELGVLPSRYMGHRRALQYLWRVVHESWFRHLLPELHGRGSMLRLEGLVRLYGLELATVLDPACDKQDWYAAVKRVTVAAAVQHLSSKAQARGLPGPEPGLKPRRYVVVGGHLCRFGVQYRQAVLEGSVARWQQPLADGGRAARRCPWCLHEESHADVAHAMECAQAPVCFADKRQAALQALHSDREQAMALLRSMQYSEAMPAAWSAMRRACRLYYEALARQPTAVVVVS
jgi:hypothetical protein